MKIGGGATNSEYNLQTTIAVTALILCYFFLGSAFGSDMLPDRDAQPIARTPPEYPWDCISSASLKETVFLEFDVTPEGETANIRVTDTTNVCFNSAAIYSVARWRYQQKFIDGEAQWRRGVQTEVIFELSE